MATKTVLETLEAARKLIEDPAHICRGVLARDAKGEVCWPTDDWAVAWCATGAVRKVTERSGFAGMRLAGDVLDILDRVSGITNTKPGDPRPIAKLSDTASHGRLLAAFDEAITKEKEAQHA